MIYLISLIYVALIILIFGKSFKKSYLPVLLVLVAALCAIEYVGGKELQKMLGPVMSYGIIQPLTKAGIATACFFFVMMCPVLPSSLTITKLARKNRTQLAIIGCVLTFMHNFIFGFTGKAFFIQMATNPAAMNPRMFISGLLSVIAVIMLIPLFVTSLAVVRKKLKPTTWKKVQLLAYPFWILINGHALVLYVFKMPQVWEKGAYFSIFTHVISIALYSIGIVLWLALKLHKRTAHRPAMQPACA